MKFTHRKIRFLARLLLVVGLLVQGTLASHACISHEASAVKAFSHTGSVSCHHTENTSMNECLMHCTQAERVNIDQHNVEIVNSSTAVLHIALLDMKTPLQVPVADNSAINTGPPLAIRFCTFLL